jgi:hypothetical protein
MKFLFFVIIFIMIFLKTKQETGILLKKYTRENKKESEECETQELSTIIQGNENCYKTIVPNNINSLSYRYSCNSTLQIIHYSSFNCLESEKTSISEINTKCCKFYFFKSAQTSSTTSSIAYCTDNSQSYISK